MLSFHSLHYSPMFGGHAALADVLDAAAAAGFTSMGVDLASIAASGLDAPVEALGSAFRDRGLRCSDVAVIVVAADATVTLQPPSLARAGWARTRCLRRGTGLARPCFIMRNYATAAEECRLRVDTRHS